MSKVVDFKSKPIGSTDKKENEKYFHIKRDSVEKIKETLESVGSEDAGIVQLQKLFTNELYEFKAFVESNYTLEDVVGLKELEKQLMEEFDANDKLINHEFYTLEGSSKEVKKLGSVVVKFLEKIDAEFRAAQVVLECINFWSEVPQVDGAYKVPHSIFDTTLRLLNSIKYKGKEELDGIVKVNQWFMPSHNAYNKNLIYTHVLSAKHQEILQLLNPGGNLNGNME